MNKNTTLVVLEIALRSFKLLMPYVNVIQTVTEKRARAEALLPQVKTTTSPTLHIGSVECFTAQNHTYKHTETYFLYHLLFN